MKKESTKQTDPRLDKQPLLLYFGGLIAVYVIGFIVFGSEASKNTLIIVVMFAPTVGALLAKFFGSGKIQIGRPSWQLLAAGLLPAVAALIMYILGAIFGFITMQPSTLLRSLLFFPLPILTGGVTAIGEEIGWRGFLWPLLRQKQSFLRTSLVVGIVWWLYHVPLILPSWYGTVGGIPAFTVAIAGFTLFVGVLTDRSRSIWPSVVAHGAWNGLVAAGFPVVTMTGETLNAFTGSTTWLGEFGWLAAISSLALGILATRWHLRQPTESSSD